MSGRGLRFSLLSRIERHVTLLTELIRGGQESHDLFGCHRVVRVALGFSPKRTREDSSPCLRINTRSERRLLEMG